MTVEECLSEEVTNLISETVCDKKSLGCGCGEVCERAPQGLLTVVALELGRRWDGIAGSFEAGNVCL